MKYFITILISFLTLSSYSQKGYNYLHKVESKLEKGDLRGVPRLIRKVNKSDYGFCGNAYASAFLYSDSLVGRYYLLKNDTTKALNVLLPNLFSSNLSDNSGIVLLTHEVLSTQYSNAELNEKLRNSVENFSISTKDSKFGSFDEYAISYLGRSIRFWPDYPVPARTEIIEALLNSKFAELIK